jgi:hypothetical protein
MAAVEKVEFFNSVAKVATVVVGQALHPMWPRPANSMLQEMLHVVA